MKTKNVVDCNGKIITPGAKAVYLYVEDTLLEGLPATDRIAILSQKNKIHEIVSIDCWGFVEIEFEYMLPSSELTYHTIWVNPQFLKVV